MFKSKSKSSSTPLPKPQDWQHRPSTPGYFITKDGQFQILPTDDGQFVICRMEQTSKGFPIVRGPSPHPEQLGIPPLLLEEAENLTIQLVIDQAEAALQASRNGHRAPHRQHRAKQNKADHFWNDQARELIAVTAAKLNLVQEDSEQRAQLLAALTRDDLFPNKTAEREAVIAAEGSWSFSGSFEEMYPFHSPLVRRSIVTAAAQILIDLGQRIPTGMNQLIGTKH